MRNINKYLKQAGLILLLSYSGIYSQTISHDHPWWVNLGAGPALISDHFAMNAGMDYCYQFDRSIISARIIGITNKNPTIQRIDKSETNYKMADYGILYGPIWQSKYGYISAGAGIGLVRITYESPTGIATNTSISLPIELQCFWRPTYFAGIGVYTYTSLNFEKQLAGLMICVQLGVW